MLVSPVVVVLVVLVRAWPKSREEAGKPAAYFTRRMIHRMHVHVSRTRPDRLHHLREPLISGVDSLVCWGAASQGRGH